MITKNTKIVCTIGPASQDLKILEAMVKAGMTCARLNFSHGTYEQFTKIIKNIRLVEKKLGIPISIIQDLQGPKIRIGELPEKGVLIKKDQIVILDCKNQSLQNHLPVQYKNLVHDVKKNDQILIDDGLIELKVISKTSHTITCKVIDGGLVKSHKGINVPTASISQNPITKKDKQDLFFGLEQNVDYVALSFVKSAKNIQELRKLIVQKNSLVKIIAKIERHEAVTNLQEIIKEADAVMVARGDLGIEIPAEQVPLIQKRIMHEANIHGKPVILATQILQSMVENPRASRAEISDAATAVFEHCDALMLSNESAVGKYPIKAVETLSKVASTIENYLKTHQEFLANNLFHENIPIAYATCRYGAKLALDIKADLIVALTLSGFTARHLAKHRIYIPIITITEDENVAEQLGLVWGLNKIYTVKKINFTDPGNEVKNFLIKNKLVKKGDKVVIVSNASA